MNLVYAILQSFSLFVYQTDWSMCLWTVFKIGCVVKCKAPCNSCTHSICPYPTHNKCLFCDIISMEFQIIQCTYIYLHGLYAIHIIIIDIHIHSTPANLALAKAFNFCKRVMQFVIGLFISTMLDLCIYSVKY